jgi:ankyrin repeat protein
VNSSDLCDATPIFIASKNGHIDIVKALSEHGAGPDNDGTTPLSCAAYNI